MSTPGGSEDHREPATIRVLGGNPTAEELAAATAVLQATLAELGGVQRTTQRTPSTWERERRGLRQPLTRGGWNIWAS